jgi:hypothetical protein
MTAHRKSPTEAAAGRRAVIDTLVTIRNLATRLNASTA